MKLHVILEMSLKILERPQTEQLEGTAYLAGAIIKLLVYCEDL